jgi:hypothetical protein
LWSWFLWLASYQYYTKAALERQEESKEKAELFWRLTSRAAFVYTWGMGRKRLPPEMREYLAKIGQKGGLKGGRARMDTMTPEQRSESARRAVQARWAKAKESTV